MILAWASPFKLKGNMGEMRSLMLGQRHRRWANTKLASVQRLVCAREITTKNINIAAVIGQPPARQNGEVTRAETTC